MARNGTEGLDDGLLTVREASVLLRLNPKTVYRLVSRGELPGVRRFGRRGLVRIHRPTLLAWLAVGVLDDVPTAIPAAAERVD